MFLLNNTAKSCKNMHVYITDQQYFSIIQYEYETIIFFVFLLLLSKLKILHL
jgi:hypothetical protein